MPANSSRSTGKARNIATGPLPSRASSCSASSSSPPHAPLPQANHEFASQPGGSVHALHDSRDDAVASQLQQIILGANATEQVNDSRSVTTIYRRPQGRALLL
jgi:hypothetical protein